MSDWGFIDVKEEDELWIKIFDDFPDDEEVEGITIVLKKDKAIKFAKSILNHLGVKDERQN